MYLIDTSILSYLFRNDPIISAYADDLSTDTQLFLSAQTVGELRVGAANRQWGARKLNLLNEFIAGFGVLPISVDTTHHYAEIVVAARRAGWPLAVPDAWIMATAKQ
jgi:predicted nucleic acid-binding protein